MNAAEDHPDKHPRPEKERYDQVKNVVHFLLLWLLDDGGLLSNSRLLHHDDISIILHLLKINVESTTAAGYTAIYIYSYYYYSCMYYSEICVLWTPLDQPKASRLLRCLDVPG